MKRFLMFCGLFLLTASMAFAGGHWSYKGDTGPAHWGNLDKDYLMCGIGKNQSPVDLANMVEAQLTPITMNYKATPMKVLNNGHTIEVVYEPGSTLTIDGHTYALKQFHFHSPSENNINGKSYLMEAHLVHADSQGNLAVVAVLYKKGEPNKTIESVWKHMPMNPGPEQEVKGASVSAAGLLPASHDYYRFNGSLTTPPCSEGVVWIVMKETPTVSQEQADKLLKAMKGPNNRPVQPLNARMVLK